MIWRRTGDKPLFEPIVTPLTDACLPGDQAPMCWYTMAITFPSTHQLWLGYHGRYITQQIVTETGKSSLGLTSRHWRCWSSTVSNTTNYDKAITVTTFRFSDWADGALTTFGVSDGRNIISSRKSYKTQCGHVFNTAISSKVLTTDTP